MKKAVKNVKKKEAAFNKFPLVRMPVGFVIKQKLFANSRVGLSVAGLEDSSSAWPVLGQKENPPTAQQSKIKMAKKWKKFKK